MNFHLFSKRNKEIAKNHEKEKRHNYYTKKGIAVQ